MTNRERFQAVMNFQPVDRLPVVEWAGWWDETIERWHGEKLPRDLTDRYDICRHFGLDVHVAEVRAKRDAQARHALFQSRSKLKP